MRIVSLVPSLTETLVEWGAFDRLVGRTRYCVEPVGRVETVEAVGGTKNPDITRIVELRPDLVVVNREENRREDYEALVGAGLEVLVTHPRTVREAAEMFVELGAAVGCSSPAKRLADACNVALEQASARTSLGDSRRVFCPIWRNPWMTFRDATYVGDMLSVAGLENIFGKEQERDFFEISIDEVLRRRPTVVLLPDEPYLFESKHIRELSGLGLVARFELICGKALSWYGPRTPAAVEMLVRLRASTP